MGQLDVVQDIDGGAVVVRVRGEVDSSSVDTLVAALDVALRAAAGFPVPTVVVELRDVTYFGSAGLNAVLGCHERGVADGIAVRVVATNAEVIRPIQVTKLDTVIRPYPSIGDALAADDGQP